MHRLKMHVSLPQRNKPMSMHAFNLLQTKLPVYVLSMFSAVYFGGASKKHGATIFYAYFRW